MNISSTHSTLKTHGRIHPLPAPLWIAVSISSLLLLLVGGSLFFFPEFARSRWVWSLTPFNTRFLGGIYLTALVALSTHLFARWAMPVRAVVPMMWTFTTVILLVSSLQIGQFDVARRANIIWFWLYTLDCIAASYYFGYYQRQTYTRLRSLPPRWSVYMELQAICLGAYGLGLLVFPSVVGSFWPWPLDPFHCQLYSAIFLTGAAGAAALCQRTSGTDLFTLGIVQFAFSSLVIAGVVVVDAELHKIDWSLPENWVWMGAIALLGLVGLGMMGESKKPMRSIRNCL